jgi:NADH-quinone oxidoreductase subunit C
MADDSQKPPEDSSRIPASARDEQAASAAEGAAPATTPKEASAGAASTAPSSPEAAASAAAAPVAATAPKATPAAKPAPPVAPKPPLGAEAAAKPVAPAAAKAAHPPPAAAPPSGPTEPPPPAGTALPAFITTLQSAVSGSVTHISFYLGDWTIVVPVTHILEVGRHLRDGADGAFDFCSDVTATDWPTRAEGRFDVIYCLYSTRHRHRVRVKLKVGEHQPVPSVTGLWPAANWLEREVYDMFGVNFTGHPDRRRILIPEDWQGFPQRKDYPLEGPGELLMENPIDWLKLRQAREQADIE